MKGGLIPLLRSMFQEGAVRLVGGPEEGSGRVEIFFNGTYGTICDNSWDHFAADVVCRFLVIVVFSVLGGNILKKQHFWSGNSQFFTIRTMVSVCCILASGCTMMRAGLPVESASCALDH